MRSAILAIAACVLLAGPACAQERYGNARFGYVIDIPAGFVGLGESANGDGQAFDRDGKPIDLRVWGGLLGVLADDFEGEVMRRMDTSSDEGWSLTYQASTPRWASFSGLKGGRILYQRMILLCDGSSYAAFQAEYSVTDRIEMDAVVEQLVQSLRASGC